jgi:tellurite resistance protein
MQVTTPTKPTSNDEQISIWLRGLLTLAWADGDFDDAEKELITSITQQELTLEEDASFRAVSSEEFAATFKPNPKIAEDFLRTAVMVALADGTYSKSEDDILEQFCQAIGCSTKILEPLRLTLCKDCGKSASATLTSDTSALQPEIHHDLLNPVRSWLDNLEIHDPKIAHFLCKMIPPQCPFERDVTLFGHKVVHIPPLCKLNPLYEQMVGLRFRALSYLADECKEDVTPYC